MRRIIALIDMDCFYAQVEQRDHPNLWGKPVIVIQHSRQGIQGGILAVSYEARKFGVKRGMNVNEAKQLCPDINMCTVPIGEFADKADIQKYRDASAEVFEVLNNYDSHIIVEKASVDEAFLDLSIYVDKLLNTDSYSFDKLDSMTVEMLEQLSTSHIADGNDKNEDEENRKSRVEAFLEECSENEDALRLAIAALTIEDIREKIRNSTQFYCSAGIANNKMTAKLVCARHKPRQQTIVTMKQIGHILKSTPIKDVRGFGGKLGLRIQEVLGISMMGEILTAPIDLLIDSFPDQHEWLRAVAQGFDDEPVKPRNESSSIAVSKNFPGRNAIVMVKQFKYWLDGLTKELSKRLATDQVQNKRTAENLVYSITTDEGRPQKTLKINSYHPEILIESLWKALRTQNRSNNDVAWQPKVYNISIAATKFTPGIPAANRIITEWLNSKSAISEEEKKLMANNTDDVIYIDEKIIKENRTNCVPSTSDSIIILDSDEEVESTKEEDRDFIEVDGKKFSRNVFNNLPPIIKKQYEHKLALESARKLKKSAAKSSRNGKRKGSTKLDSQNESKKLKPLSSFFNRSSH